MKANDSNDPQKEVSMHINKPTARRIAVLCRILQNSFVLQQNTVSTRQHIKSYSGMSTYPVRLKMHAHCVFSVEAVSHAVLHLNFYIYFFLYEMI
jgi:hypothetical protein